MSGSVDSGGSATYQVTASIKDEHGFDRGTGKHTFTIATADLGTLGGDTASHIIEELRQVALLRNNSDGRTGTQRIWMYLVK